MKWQIYLDTRSLGATVADALKFWRHRLPDNLNIALVGMAGEVAATRLGPHTRGVEARATRWHAQSAGGRLSASGQRPPAPQVVWKRRGTLQNSLRFGVTRDASHGAAATGWLRSDAAYASRLEFGGFAFLQPVITQWLNSGKLAQALAGGMTADWQAIHGKR